MGEIPDEGNLEEVTKQDNFMKEVYKKELGSNFKMVDNGVGVGTYESESNEETLEGKGADTRSTETSRQKTEGDRY